MSVSLAGIENFIIPRLPCVDCSLVCIGTHAPGRQMTSLLCQGKVIM